MTNQDNETFFQGEVVDVRAFPFLMRPWEMNRVYEFSPPLKFNGTTDFLLLRTAPLWFRGWLWLRTVVARIIATLAL